MAVLKKLESYVRGLLAAVFVCAAALAAVVIQRPPNWAAYTLMILAAGLTMLFYIYIPARKKLMLTQLIVENAILHIEPAVLHGHDGEAEESLCEAVRMYVSVFGIMLGGKIIKWGHDGGLDCRLKAVEIGHDYLSIDYGTKDKARKIRMLYDRPDSSSLADIIEKFRYETGIVPVVKE